MSEMIDRVAEALAQSFRDTVAKVSGQSWEETGVTLPSREVFERYARAAIEAMREPTEAMVQSGCVWFRQYDPDFDPLSDNINNAWQAMIDAALNPTQS